MGSVLWLHRLRPPRRTERVSSLILWAEVHKESVANRKRRRILSSLILLAQVSALAILAFVLAGPHLLGARPELHVAFLVDTSASMTLESNSGSTRQAEVIKRLTAFLNEGDAGRYTLITSTGAPLRYDGSSLSALRAALANLSSPIGASDWTEALQTLEVLSDPRNPPFVVVATDGTVTSQDASLLHGLAATVPVFALQVGEGLDNVAITELTARPVTGGADTVQVLINVANFGTRHEEIRLEVHSASPRHVGAEAGVESGGESGSGIRIEEESMHSLYEGTLTLGPKAQERVVVNHTWTPGSALRARVDHGDAQPLDNTAYLVAPPDTPFRTLLVGRGSELLHTGLATLDDIRLDNTLLANPPRALAAEYDLVIFHDQPVPDEFEGTALALRSGREAGTNDPGVEVTWWHPSHPLSRFVDWQSLAPGPAKPLGVTPGARVLVESSAGPLVTVEENQRQRIVNVSIPLERSDFPFRVAYPIFLHNVILWASNLTVENPMSLPLGTLPSAAIAKVSLGTGTSVMIEPWQWPGDSPSTPFTLTVLDSALWSELAKPGVYTWTSGGTTGVFGTGLLSGDESDLSLNGNPRGLLDVIPSLGERTLNDLGAPIDGDKASTRLGTPSTLVSINSLSGKIAVFIVALILTLEAALYMRRFGRHIRQRSIQR